MKRQRSIVLFLVKFFVTYFVLFVLYSFYIHRTQVKEGVFSCDPITSVVAKQATDVINFFGYNARYVQHEKEMSIKVFLQEIYVARVIEGCNSLSIIILFLAFVVAFPGSIKATLLFGIIGSFLIYGVNILRVAFLIVMFYKFPNQQTVLHNLVFPAIIYGFVFLLWVFWVRKFSNYKK